MAPKNVNNAKSAAKNIPAKVGKNAPPVNSKKANAKETMKSAKPPVSTKRPEPVKTLPAKEAPKAAAPKTETPPIVKEDTALKALVSNLRSKFGDVLHYMSDDELAKEHHGYATSDLFNQAVEEGDVDSKFLEYLNITTPQTVVDDADAGPANDMEELDEDLSNEDERPVLTMPDGSEEELREITPENVDAYIAEVSGNGAVTIEPANTYVHERDGEPLATEEIIDAIVDANDDTPDAEFMKEFLLSHELDESKKAKFFTYIDGLTHDQLKTLWESFKGTYGSNVATITAIDQAAKLIKSVETSKVLEMRNNAAHAELARMGTMFTQIQRALRIEASDAPLNALRVDNVSKAIAKLSADLTTLNSAIIEMAQMLMLGEVDGDAADMAINVERAVKLCAIVGYSAKGWAKVHDQATADRKALQAEIETLKASLKTANEATHNAQALKDAEVKRVNALILRANSFTIRNNSGNFITTINKLDDENADYFRVSSYNVRVTQDENEALTFDDLETARKVFDAVKLWSKRNIRVRKMLKAAGVDAETLFIAASSMVKVD